VMAKAICQPGEDFLVMMYHLAWNSCLFPMVTLSEAVSQCPERKSWPLRYHRTVLLKLLLPLKTLPWTECRL